MSIFKLNYVNDSVLDDYVVELLETGVPNEQRRHCSSSGTARGQLNRP